MNNYLVTYLPTDPPTHHTYLPPYFLTYFPRRRRSLNKTLTFLYKDERRSLNKTWARGHAARSHGGAPQRLHAAHRDRVHQNL